MYGGRMADDRYEYIVLRLRAISDDIGDLVMATLREAIESGAGSRPPQEKVLAQARRAVDKAASLLEGSRLTDD